MLRRLVFVPAVTLVRASRPTYWPAASSPGIVVFSTSRPPSEDTQTPTPGRVAGRGDSKSTDNVQGKPPDTTHSRLTGDEVEEAFDPMGNVGRRMEKAVKGAASTVKEVLIDREDPIVAAGEEAYQSVPKYQESIDLTAQRAKEQLQGHVWPEGKEGAKIEVPREARKEDAEEGSEGGGEGGVLEGVKETVKQTLQEGVEKLKGGVETATEAIRKEGARHEEEMQAVAEEQRKKVTKKQGGSGGGGREGGKERKRG